MGKEIVATITLIQTPNNKFEVSIYYEGKTTQIGPYTFAYQALDEARKEITGH